MQTTSNSPGANGSCSASPRRTATFSGRALPRLREQLGDEIDTDDLPDERREREGKGARAGADVERALLARQGQEPATRSCVSAARRSWSLGDLVRSLRKTLVDRIEHDVAF